MWGNRKTVAILPLFWIKIDMKQVRLTIAGTAAANFRPNLALDASPEELHCVCLAYF